MKTIKEHFLDLGPKLAKQAIAACIRTQGEGILDSRRSDMANAINDGINFRQTREGPEFWNGLHRAFASTHRPAGFDPSHPEWIRGNDLGIEAKGKMEQFSS